jgi:predicted PurR-regulated permease PerM
MDEYVARRGLWVVMVLVLVGLLWLLAPVLTPFVVSALLAWLGDPMVARLERAGRSRTTAVLIVFGLMTLIVVLSLLVIVPLLQDQVLKLIAWLPQLSQWAQTTAIPWLENRTGLKLAGYIDPSYLLGLLQEHWQQAGGVATSVLGGLSKSGLAVLGFLASVALVPVVTFYFLRDWRPMLEQIRQLVPRPLEPTVSRLAAESNEVLGGFIRGQLSVMLSLGTIYAVGLWAVGLDLGLLIGFVAGLVSFIPYLGAIVGVSAAIIATLVQHGDIVHLALVIGVFMVGQTLEGFLLVPWLVGDKIGMHPVAVIFAIMAGGQLFGFLGVLLALPVAAVAMVLLRYAHEQYTSSHLYVNDEEDPSPIILSAHDALDDAHSRPDV